MKRKVNWSRAAVIVVTFSALLPTEIARAESAGLRLEPCSMEGITGDLRCGSYEVFENRETRTGRRIPLKIILLGAETKSAPDPLFILAGGPGQAATENLKFNARTFAAVRRERDIVLVDQRGTGGSNGLECDLYGSSTQAHLGDLFPIEAVQRCADEWKARADLRFYTTEIAMTDLDEIRGAMGYERINLFGTSYGTRAAQVYMRQFPDRVRSVILKGVTPMRMPLTRPMARDAQRSWDILCDDCATDPACGAAFPNLTKEFHRLMRQLERPVETKVDNEKVKISRAAIVPTIRTMLQSIDSAAQLPQIIHAAAQGDYAPLAKAALDVRRGFPKAVSVGAFLTISSIEDVAISDPEAIRRASAGTFLRDDYFKQLHRVAAVLPQKKMPEAYREPVRSEIPTLLISGFTDPATPPDGAEEVAKQLPKSKHIVARYGSHSYGGMSPCMDQIMAEFIARGSADGIDSSCVEQIRRPPFVTSATAAEAKD